MILKRTNSSIFTYKSKKKKKLFNDNIGNDKNTNELLLNKIQNRKELIHKEILGLINKNLENIEQKLNSDNFNSEGTLNINTSKSQDKENFQNYSGEKITLITFSNTQTIDKEKDTLNNNENNQINNYLYLNNEKIKNKKICKNRFKLKKLKNPGIIINNYINEAFETITDKDTLINISNFENINDNDESSLKLRIIILKKKMMMILF
jgi:hypothetical protein